MRKILETLRKGANKFGLPINKEKIKYMETRVDVMDENKLVMVGLRIEKEKQSTEWPRRNMKVIEDKSRNQS